MGERARLEGSDGTISDAGEPGAVACRALVPSDLARVCRLHFASFRVQSSRRFLSRAYYPAFLDPASTGFGRVAEDENGLAGYCVGVLDDGAFHRALLRRHPIECLLAHWRKRRAGGRSDPGRAVGREARLHYVAVDRVARGRGLGRRLVVDALRVVREAGCPSCASRIYADNEASRRLNLELGFRAEMESRDELGGYALYRVRFDRSGPDPGSQPSGGGARRP